MSPLAHHLDSYMAIRRSLGFKLTSEHRLLGEFAAFMDAAGTSTVTIELALRWATTPTGVGHAYLAQRMRAVRGFARYLHGIDPATEIPPLELLPARRHRPTPHIYSEAEIAALMAAARTLRPALRATTMETLIGLLACPACGSARRSRLTARTSTPITGCCGYVTRSSASRARSSSTTARWPR